jgi:hypothetical protein
MVTLDSGEVMNFRSALSQRGRSGHRYTRDHNPRMSYYFGGYVEHEFDGEADGSLHGINFGSVDCKGTTGIGEVGIIFHSTDDRPWNVEAGFQGYAGNMRGFSGGFRFGYQF